MEILALILFFQVILSPAKESNVLNLLHIFTLYLYLFICQYSSIRNELLKCEPIWDVCYQKRVVLYILTVKRAILKAFIVFLIT